jgi:hypothetical protein
MSKKKQSRYGLIVLVIALVAIVWYANSRKELTPVREAAVAPESIGGFGAEGKGGDPSLNKQKNRFTMPLDVKDVSVASILQIPTSELSGLGRSHRERWPVGAVDFLREQETRGVRVTGYLVAAKEEGPESCNGYSDSLHDFHIWISDAPSFEKSNGLIVEMTPRWQSVRPDWKMDELRSLVREHARVRVTGWLLWDEEHPDEVGKSRASQWEIHPVTQFEVLDAGNWHPI